MLALKREGAPATTPQPFDIMVAVNDAPDNDKRNSRTPIRVLRVVLFRSEMHGDLCC